MCLASNSGTCFSRFDCITQPLATKSDPISGRKGEEEEMEGQNGSCSRKAEDALGFLFLKVYLRS